MKFYNTTDNPELIQQFVGYCKIQIAKCKMSMSPWESEWYEQKLSDIYTMPVYFVYDSKKRTIVCILNAVTRFDTTIWQADRREDIAAIVLRQNYPEGFFLSGDGYVLNKSNLHPAIAHSSYDNNTHYPVIEHLGVWTNNPNKTTYFRDWLEKKYLTPPPNWESEIVFKWGPHKMFAEQVYDESLQDYPWQQDSFGHYAYIGMHYTNWEHNTDHVNYLLATVNEHIIGCICVFDYNDIQYGPKHYGMSYIDVSGPYKNNGLAKRMIHELTKHLSNDKPLLLSRESREGAKCHMHECFKREIWPHSVMSQDDFDMFCMQQKQSCH